MQRSTLSNIHLACWTLGLLALVAVWGQWTGGLRAQEPAANSTAAADAPAPADQDKEESAKADGSFGRMIFVDSGKFALAFYIVLGIFSLVMLTVIMERLVNLQRDKVMPPEFLQRLRDLVSRKEDTLENLRSLADSSGSPIAKILKAGCFRAGRPLPEVEKAMEDALAKEMAAMRGRNRPLSVVGSVAPLVGLLGTVVGMIFAFMVSSKVGPGKGELLAKGIYMALITTAAGLTIAIPALLFFAWFGSSAERFMRDVDEALLDTLPAFAKMENSTANGLIHTSDSEPVSSATG